MKRSNGTISNNGRMNDMFEDKKIKYEPLNNENGYYLNELFKQNNENNGSNEANQYFNRQAQQKYNQNEIRKRTQAINAVKRLKKYIDEKHLNEIEIFAKEENLSNTKKNRLYELANKLYGQMFPNGSNIKIGSKSKFLRELKKQYLIKFVNVKKALSNKIKKNSDIVKKLNEESERIDEINEKLNEKIELFKNNIKMQDIENKDNIITIIDNIIKKVDDDKMLNNIDRVYYKRSMIKKLQKELGLPEFNKTTDADGNKVIKNIDNKYNYMVIKKPYLFHTSLKRGVTYKNNTIKIIPSINYFTEKELMILFGIDKLIQYTDEEKNKILKYVLDGAVNITENLKFTDKDYIKNELFMIKLTDILLKKKFKISINNIKKNGKLLGKGAYGEVYENIDKKQIYKLERLRYIEKNEGPRRFSYRFFNYVPSTIFISYIIQHYLHYKFPNIVPDINTIDFSYNNNIGITLMNKAIKEPSVHPNFELYHYIKTNIYRRTYVNDFLNILYELCDILITMQNDCAFVHYDIHLGNLLINYNYDKNKFSFNLKLIDFGVASIIINNGSYKLIKYINMKQHKYPLMFNPYVSTLWYKYDLLYFIASLLLKYSDLFRMNMTDISELKDDDNYKYRYDYENEYRKILIRFNSNELKGIPNDNYELLVIKLCEIFNISLDFRYNTKIYIRESIKNGSYEGCGLTFRLTQNQDARDKIYGKNLKINNFDPRVLKKVLQEGLNKI